MKKLQTFLTENPSYVKCGNAVIATRLNISEATVAKFKKTKVFKILNNQYRNGVTA